jgi:hypothetical protein
MNNPKKFQLDFTAPNGVPSSCNVYHYDVDKTHYIGLEDIGIGMSVTNASEVIATEIVKQKNWEPEYCLFFEWFDYYNDNDSVDEVIHVWKDGEAVSATWKPFCKIKDNPFK